MNTLTQQQINQYQWQVADGVAVPVNPYVSKVKQPFLYPEFEAEKKSRSLQTNAPDGIYSGEAFEKPVWQYSVHGLWVDVGPTSQIPPYNRDTRQFLRLKPSHLPAVLTTQPGEEWKDTYSEVWYLNGEQCIEEDYDMFDTYDYFMEVCLSKGWVPVQQWRLNTPPAEQETVEQAADLAFFIDEEWAQIDKYVQYSKRHGFMRGAAWQLEQLQSTLTQKDQRIAELEREWISVEKRKPDNISTVLIWTNISINPTLGYYVSDDWLYFSHHDNFWLKTEKHIKVVKWMPLPNPPQH
jgi:hypothetical protein